jgi:large subunit ribosomal protein L24
VKIRKGDTVEVIAGNDAGRRAEVLHLIPVRHRVVVEGANVRKKHQKQQQTGGQRPLSAGIIEFEAPIHVSNVMLVCPKCDASVRVGWHRAGDEKRRVCKKCGEAVDS